MDSLDLRNSIGLEYTNLSIPTDFNILRPLKASHGQINAIRRILSISPNTVGMTREKGFVQLRWDCHYVARWAFASRPTIGSYSKP